MTINALNVSSGPFIPNGVTTSFPFTFEVLEGDEVIVTLDGVEVDPSAYSVALNVDGTGSVDFAVAPTGLEIYLYTDPDFSQGTSLENQGPYFQQTVEKMIDRVAMGLLWVRSLARRALVVPVNETPPVLGSLAGDNNGKALGFVDGKIVPVANDGASISQAVLDVEADRQAVAADKAIVAADKGTVAADKATVAGYTATTLGYRNETEGFKDDAETALLAAQGNAGIFADVATYEGGAPVNGEYYWIVSPDIEGALDLYLYTGGASVDQNKSIPAASVVDALNGVVGEVAADPVETEVYGLSDIYGNVIYRLDGDGVAKFARLDADELVGIPVRELKRRLMSTAYIPAQTIGLMADGQSLSVGNGTVAWSLDSEFVAGGHVKFNANGDNVGPRAQEGSGTLATNRSALVPYGEDLSAFSGNGETVLGRAMKQIEALLEAENGIAPGENYRFLGSAPGKGNTDLNDLQKGSTPYNESVADVQYGAALANADGETYAIPAIFHIHGQGDINDNSTLASYRDRFLTRVSDKNTDFKEQSGQVDDVVFLASQCQAENQYDAGNSGTNIALALLEAADQDDRIVVVCPEYQWISLAIDNPHLTYYGYGEAGCLFGLAWKRVIIDREPWDRFVPTKVSRYQNVLNVQYPDMRDFGDLVLDDYFKPLVANYGFSATKASDGTENAITSVEVTGPRSLRIVMTSAEAGTLKYAGDAANGIWYGNLRADGVHEAAMPRARKISLAALTMEKVFA